MSQEEKLKEDLVKKFAFLDGSIKIQRSRRITAETAYANFPDVFKYVVTDKKISHLCTITGLDENEKFTVIYHLAAEDGTVLNLKTSVPRQTPVIKTVTPYFSSAENYERELVDLFGIQVTGLPPGNRYPLTDDWPEGQFPLRKDWKNPDGEKKEADNNA